MRKVLPGLLVIAVTAVAAQAGGLRNDPGLILDIEEGSWRVFMGWKTPVLVTDDGKQTPMRERKRVGTSDADRKAVPVHHSWYPPADWTQAGFDDTYWPRSRGKVVVTQPKRFGEIWKAGNPAEWNLVCLRGRFMVTDPAKVNMPRLKLAYYGGAVIYVNGKEIHRGHLPEGEITFETPAEPYPKEAYVRPNGHLYGFADAKDGDFKERFAKRLRDVPPKVWVDAIGIPKELLKKGVNVIAIENHRAAVRDVAVEGVAKAGSWQDGPCSWPHAGIARAQFYVGSPVGIEPNVAPSEGLAVGAPHPWESLTAYDYAHPLDEPRPISLVGVRNAYFSGRVLVSSRETIYGLKGTVTDLVTADGKAKIPASSVQVRYAEPCHPTVSWRRYPYFDRLLEEAPEEIPAVPIKIRGRKLLPVPTAVCPVWVTVRVPEDADPGDYTGALTIETEDWDPVKVPLKLKVYDYGMRDPKDFRLSHNVYQSFDSVAMYYKVPLWSDKHFELMVPSLEILREMGSRVCMLTLCVRASNVNNTESMVRWIKQPDGTFKYDFTNVEKYLDLYEKVVGKPRILPIYIMDYEGRNNELAPRPVSVFDPKTGALTEMDQPAYGTDANREFWRPVLTELRERLIKRKWWDVSMMGHVSYCWSPTKETAKNIKDIWPDGKWISSCHGYRAKFGGLPVLCNEWVWASGRLHNPEGRYKTYPRPWQKRRAGFTQSDMKIWRGGFRDNHPLSAYRAATEGTLQRGLHGYGRQGADFWPVQIGKSRRLQHLSDTGYALGHAINVIAMISPGPKGAIWNGRAQVIREGHQIAETIADVLQAIDDGKVNADLAKRAQELITARARQYCRVGWQHRNQWMAFASSGVHLRDEQLFAIAAEMTAQQAAPKAEAAKAE